MLRVTICVSINGLPLQTCEEPASQVKANTGHTRDLSYTKSDKASCCLMRYGNDLMPSVQLLYRYCYPPKLSRQPFCCGP